MHDELEARYGTKVAASVDELLTYVGPYPRERPIVLCHGVFDVVHPGHLRHLAYAKAQANLLVVSVTADEHISKGTYRPYVPDALRALNLAALEMVDFVIIDFNATPIENLLRLRPEYYAKGFEYASNHLTPATLEEIAALDTFGGRVIFTPGDVVYSSTNLLSGAMPSLASEKLASVMRRGGLTQESLLSMLRNLEGIRVHVVGDVIVDRFLRTRVIGGQVKTPTISVQSLGEERYAGGAALVSQTLAGAGASVVLSTVMGTDEQADFVSRKMVESSVTLNAIVEPLRPTTSKLAVIADKYRMLKIDTLDNSPIAGPTLDALLESIHSVDAEVVIFSDFRHGIFSSSSVGPLRRAIPSSCFSAADSQVASRWGNILEFEGFDLLTPNEREARFALGDQDSVVGSLARAVKRQSNCGTLMLKLGARGVLCLFDEDSSIAGANFSIDSMTNSAVDPVGAGDAFLAYASLVLYKFQSPHAAAIIGSAAAAAACDIDGNASVTPQNVQDVMLRAFHTGAYLIT